jgi:signal transduction histidine kinase/HAMP domain-containing protein
VTIRKRIIVGMVPLLVLLLALGGVGTILIYQLSHRVGDVLRENYDSIAYMGRLNEALDRIDGSFLLALAGRKTEASNQYQAGGDALNANLLAEQRNITLPGERELADRLSSLSQDYKQQADAFFAAPGPQRELLYFGHQNAPGLRAAPREIRATSDRIAQINQEWMEHVNQESRRIADSSLLGYGLGGALGIALAVLLVAGTIRAIRFPIGAMAESARAIGAGDLDQMVSVADDDEFGDLATRFNTMARQLRELRESHAARLVLAQQTTQAAIDALPDPVVVVDDQQRVELANRVARRLLGLLPQPQEGGSALEQVASMPWQPPAPLRQPLADALQHQSEYLPEGFDKTIMLRTGDTNGSFLPRILPMRNACGSIVGATVLLQNVTRLRLLDEMKSNLVATVSHELKTPLTSIRLALHLLLEEITGPLLPKQLELLVDARDNAERLLAMIDNLLDLARLEQGRRQLDLRPVKPVTLLRPIAEAFRPRSAEQGVEFALEVPADLPEVVVEADQIEHALQNLLDNALSYTPQGGRIALSARLAGQQIALTVTDTGRGIPPEFVESVFGRYFRIPGSSVPGGSGLGLAIVHEIATAHGGAVQCESQPGVKTTFRILIPIRKPAKLAERMLQNGQG